MVSPEAVLPPDLNSDGTALVILVPEAADCIDTWRMRYDWSAQHGMAPHITVLLPFIEIRSITDLDLAILAKLCSGHAGFSFHLSKPRLFQNYVYFSPNPSAPFICLTRAVLAQYPRLTPYGGRFGKAVIPHLSVAFSEDAAVLETVAAAVSNVEVHATAHEIHLMDCRDGWWRPVAAFQLGDAS
jgi:hypothetical protein